MKTFSLVIGAALLASGCCKPTCCEFETIDGCYSDQTSFALKGRFEGDRYFSPSGAFSAMIPSDYRKHIEEESRDDFAVAIFFDPAGQLVRFEVETLPPDLSTTEILEKVDNADYLQTFANDLVVTPIQNLFPGTTATHHKTVRFENGKEHLYIILTIPGASPWVDEATEKPVDSVRGYLLSFEGNQIVTLSHQRATPPTGASEADVADIYKTMQQIRSSYRNEFIN